ncbi:MAG: D-alanyl-D-alanine carboxypeptidase/D-alanyl-D-alanine endopeptidase [Ignavibacterium sp.]|uniref:D-alanyl-D-alanine carboxypeptidase/D-alanyl-D-alanine endopeptidase n=1 Tax=Ignavibacterium sp. TaxID=2651167 RepID=UPI0040492228
MAKIFLLALLLVSLTFPQSISSRINKIISNKFFDTCLIAIQVEDLTTNKTLFRKNEKMLLRPASNMKIITSAAGLIYLGEDYQFTTNLYYDGFIANDTLFGNIFVEGGCDPDFTTQDFYVFVEAIKNLNINFITGNLYGDVSFKDSLYWGKGWMWDDDPSSDAPRLSALNLNDNCVELFFSNGQIEISPRTKFVDLLIYDDDTSFTVDRDWLNNTDKIIIRGKPESNAYFKVNITNPEKYFLTVFREVLDSNNIKVFGENELKDIPADVFYITSVNRKYSDVIVNLNKNSDNLSAEMTLYAIAEKYFGRPATAENGIKILKQLIDSIGFQSNNYRIVDGSGVSHYNVVNAELLSGLLKYFYKKYPDKFRTLYDSFPIAGIDGTLENRMKNSKAFNNVHAKTGTLTGVSCISGYVTTRKNHTLAFSIMMQNFVGSAKRVRDYQDKILEMLAEMK